MYCTWRRWSLKTTTDFAFKEAPVNPVDPVIPSIDFWVWIIPQDFTSLKKSRHATDYAVFDKIKGSEIGQIADNQTGFKLLINVVQI